MPLGNSITEGTDVNPSYRDELYYSLTDAYIRFDYVGSRTSLLPLGRLTPLPSCNLDPGTISMLAHEGHWGWRAEEIINGRADAPTEGKLAEWLQAYTPDVVLMHVGTNDMFQNQPVAETLEELREIVRILRQDNPKVIVLIAKLFPAYAPVVGPAAANNINLLNSSIPALVQELHTALSPILLVDQNTGFDPTPGMHSYDGVHPDWSGASQMARRWSDVLRTVLSSYTTPPTVNIITPENYSAHEAGQPVAIVAEARDREEGVERVEFYVDCQKIGEDLTSPYNVNWTPSTAGSYWITARATDAAGASSETFPVHIDVVETVTGKITREYWANIYGSSVTSIPVTSTPTSISEIFSFEAPSNVADNYGQRVRGYVTAPVTGEYTFWIASDDYSELWLSTSVYPADKVKLAFVDGWTNPQDWGKYSSQQSVKVTLEAGKRYYIEALHLEMGGGDNLAVGWQLPDGTLERPIPGDRLTPFKGGTTPPPAISYTLTMAVSGAGAVSPAGGTFLEDEIVSLQATPAAGYEFSGWSGDAYGANNPQLVVMNRNRNVMATFTKVEQPTELVSNVAATTGRNYSQASLAVGARVYTDRTYQATAVPSFLDGASLIQTANDDKKNTSSALLSFVLSHQATVYIAYDPRARALPAWLDGWQRIPDRIGVNDSKISYMNLYSKTFPAGTVTLGGNLQSPAAGAQNNYFVMAKQALTTNLISNITPTTGKSYVLGDMGTGITYYTDRSYKTTSVPASLDGAPFVKTANDDKRNAGTILLSFELTQNATVYVAYDPRATVLPSWLSGWQRVEERVGVNDPKISYMNLYSKSFQAGKVSLGGNMVSPAAGAQNNYFVVVQAAQGLATSAAGLMQAEDTGAAADDSKLRLKVFPNPNTGAEVQVEMAGFGSLEPIAVSLHDMVGRVIQSTSLVANMEGDINSVIPLEKALSPGVYLIRAKSASGQLQARLVVQ